MLNRDSAKVRKLSIIACGFTCDMFPLRLRARPKSEFCPLSNEYNVDDHVLRSTRVPMPAVAFTSMIRNNQLFKQVRTNTSR